MPADAPRQVFRPSPPNYVIGWVLTTFFVLLGLVFVLGGLGGGDWAGPEIMGVVLLLLAAFGIRAMATSVLIATPAELVYWWNWTRRRSLDWTEIQSFGVGAGRSRGGWPTVIITLNTGARIRTEVAAYRRSYPARISAELTALQRQYAPAPPSSGSDQSTVRTMGAGRRAQRARAGRYPDRPVRTAQPVTVTTSRRFQGHALRARRSLPARIAGVREKPRHRLPP